MKITYTARKVNLRDNFKERVEKKLLKFQKLFSEDAAVNVVVTLEKNRQTVEITIRDHGMVYRAESTMSEMNDALDKAYEYKYDRSQELKKREKNEIGISAVRGGNIVGEHEVIFAGTDEGITFKHTAYSKGVFAKGAVEAAKFLAGKAPGYYDMADVIAAK